MAFASALPHASRADQATPPSPGTHDQFSGVLRFLAPQPPAKSQPRHSTSVVHNNTTSHGAAHVAQASPPVGSNPNIRYAAPHYAPPVFEPYDYARAVTPPPYRYEYPREQYPQYAYARPGYAPAAYPYYAYRPYRAYRYAYYYCYPYGYPGY